MNKNGLLKEKSIIILSLCIISLLGMRSYSLAAQNASFNPGWELGDWWEVEVLQRADYVREANPPWLAPLHWRFEVLAVETAQEMQDEPIDGPPITKECFKIEVTNLDNPSKAPSLLLYYDIADFHLVRGEIYSTDYYGRIRLSKGDDFPLVPFNVPKFSTLTEKKSEKAFCKALNREVDVINVEVENMTYSGPKSKQQWSKSAPWWLSYKKGDNLKATLTGCSQCK